MTTINFDLTMLKRFKKAFNKAEKTVFNRATNESKTIFTFEGNQFDLGYAKYLIEYLEEQFKTKED